MLSKNYINEENYIDETSHKGRKTIKKIGIIKKQETNVIVLIC